MKDCAGQELSVGDCVYIYWGHNRLCPGTIKSIQGKGAVVTVDTGWTGASGRYVDSKLKGGECMIKVTV